MNASASEALGWSRSRWWVAFLLVMGAQVGLIFSLSDRKPLSARKPGSTTTFHLLIEPPPASPIAEWLKIQDPAVFALPDPRAFSGLAWMTPPPLRHQSADWTEPANWLTLSTDQLGSVFAEFDRTNTIGPPMLAVKPEPQPDKVTAAPVPLPATTTVRLEGDLAKRELLASLEPPSMPHSEILTETVIQVCVNPMGVPFSSVLLGSSGSAEADRQALALVKSARFKPLAASNPASRRDPAALTWGKIIFQWHTAEPPAAPAPTTKSSP